MVSSAKKSVPLHLDRCFEDGDAFYATLVEAIDRMDEAQVIAFLSRLTLILANQIGRQDVLEEAIAMSLRDIKTPDIQPIV